MFWFNVIAMNRPFEVICEIEPPTGPDLTHARHQIGVLSPVADAFLIPDNHIGRATVSSIAVAHEVQAMGGNTIACLNSRDRVTCWDSAGTCSPRPPTVSASSCSSTATSQARAGARAT
jgi:hypothetical protein